MKWELIVVEPRKANKFIPIPNCDRDKEQTIKRYEKGSRFLNNGDESLSKIINLRAILNYLNIEICVPIVNIYFEVHNIYIYAVDKNNIVKRSLITSNGTERIDETIIESRLVYFFA